MPWTTDGMPADERPVDPGALIDVSHAGVDAVELPLSELLAKRREREAVEARPAARRPVRDRPGAGADRPHRRRRAPGAGRARARAIDGAGDFATSTPARRRARRSWRARSRAPAANAVLAIAVNGRDRGDHAHVRRRRPDRATP